MNKTNFIIGLIVLILILLFMNFSVFGKNNTNLDYDEMTAGQVLDVKIKLDNEIWVLEKQRDEVIHIYNIKRWRETVVDTGTEIENTGL